MQTILIRKINYMFMQFYIFQYIYSQLKKNNKNTYARYYSLQNMHSLVILE